MAQNKATSSGNESEEEIPLASSSRMTETDDSSDPLEKQPLVQGMDESDEEEDEDGGREVEEAEIVQNERLRVGDPRFNPPPPSPLKRFALVAFTLFLFYLAISIRKSLHKEKKPEVIYANRYSKEHKFRPAASPIITETLKDGRIRIRGAAPTATPEPKPAPTPKKTRSKRRAKKPAKRAGGARK